MAHVTAGIDLILCLARYTAEHVKECPGHWHLEISYRVLPSLIKLQLNRHQCDAPPGIVLAVQQKMQ